MKIRFGLLLFFLILMNLNAYAGWLWGPNNFEECVAENIKNTSSEQGARAITIACRKLFPVKKYKNYEQCVNEKKIEKELQGSFSYIDPESDCREYFPTDKTKNYFNCILKNMKGVSTDTAARVIINNCRRKYNY